MQLFTLGKVIQNILYYYSSLFLFSINSQYNSKYSKEHLKFDSTDSNIKQTTTFDPNIFLYFDNESTDQLGYYIYTNMSRQHQVEIYTYTLTVLNLTLKVKFPCRIYLEHQGKGVTNQVQATNNNKFIFNQQVTLKNQTEKEHIELVVQLITEKGAKYVGGVVKLVQKQLIGSEGQCISIPIIKCLDPEAACEVRVDQVASSRISKKDSPKGKNPLRSQYHHEFNILSSKKKPHFNQEGETKSQYNFPISLNRAKDKADYRKQPMIVINSVRKGKGNESMIMQRQQTMSMVGGTAMSALQFEVYKEGYNKLKDKYRKEAEVARAQMSKRVALQTSQNNLKLQMMRYKLKAEELQKNLTQKSQKIKDLSENISILQKKQLDSKYLKQQIENKAHTIKSLEETIKGLNKDNSQLKRLQLEKYQTDQQTWTNLKEDMQKLKKDHEYRQAQLQRQIKLKIDIIGKKEYEYSSKCEELERARCNIEDLQKSLSIKTFQWQKVLQNERGTAKARQQQLKQKRNSVEQQRNKLDQRLNQFTQLIQELKTQISKLQYEKKISNQNYESIVKQNEDLKIIKDKYTELTKQLKKTLDEKKDLQKSKQRQVRQKSIELDELTIKYTLLLDLYKKSTKQWDEKQKNFQSKQSQSTAQIQSNNNFIQKLKRQNQNQAKELNQLKAYLKDLKNEIKGKDDKILLLTNELTDSKNKSNQSDYSVKIQLARTKEDLEKMTNKWKQAEAIALASNESNGNLQLLLNKSKVEYQFKEQKLSKELGYAKDKISSLEIVKSDLDNQIASLSLTITNFKQNEKGMIQKIQRLELESIKTKESQQKMKKEIKILEQKGQNNQASIKNKQKQITDILLGKQSLKKKTAQLQVELGSLKNELNKQISQKQRYQKISEILQGDLNKAKEEHTRLNELIVTRQNIQNGLRQQLKKEKQDFTKLDMKLNASKKQFQKFKETLVQNLNTVFSSIPEGSFAQSKIKSTVIQKSGTSKENSEVLNLLISYGRQTRNNVVKTLQQLKQAVRDNEKLSSDYSLSVNKFNTNQFEYSQGITAIQQQLSQLLQQKQIEQNNYEQEIFLLEGRVKQKEMLIYELTQQVQQLDYTLKNIKGQFQFFREDAQKKQITKNKLIQQLRDQIQYYRLEITTLEGHSEKLQSKYESTDQELQNSLQLISRINKQLNQTKQSLQANEETLSNLRKQLKKTNDSKEQLALAFAQKQEQLKKSESTLQDQQKKSSELRDFVKQLMKQKEQVIKNELQKSENVLILQTTVEQLKHQIESLQESLKTTTKSQEQLKQTVKRLAKNLKEQQLSKNEQKMKNIKSNDRLKDKEKEIVVKDEIISKLQQKLRKEVEKKNRQIKQLEQQVDNTQIKLLNTERETSQKILNLENDIQRVSDQLQKTTQSLILTEQSLFKQKTRIAEQRQSINSLQKEIQQHKQRIQELTTKNSELDQQLRFSQQSSFKMQGKINLLEMKIQSKEKQHNQIVNNFNQDWSSKYYSMEDQYEQRLQLNNKQREFLKEKIAEYEKQSKRLLLQIKSSQNNSSSLKKNYQQKIKSLQQDRLTTIAQKNTENQRLVDDIRISSQNLKSKQTQCRKMSNQIQSLKASLLKTESRYRQAEEKIRNINRNHQIQLQELKKKQQSFKKLKEIVTSSIWKSQRQARRVIQTNIRQIIDIVDEKSTIKVMEIARQLQQNVITAISFKIDQKEI